MNSFSHFYKLLLINNYTDEESWSGKWPSSEANPHLIVLTRCRLRTILGRDPSGKAQLAKVLLSPSVGTRFSRLILCNLLLVILVNISSKEILIRWTVYSCHWVREPLGWGHLVSGSQAEVTADVRRRGPGDVAPVQGDYLVSWALLMGLGGAASLPEGPGRLAAATVAVAAGPPWLRASEGTLRVLGREEKLQEHRWAKEMDSRMVSEIK